MPVPDFTAYRRDSTKNPDQKSENTQANRNAFNYLIMGGAGSMGAYGATSLGEKFARFIDICWHRTTSATVAFFVQ